MKKKITTALLAVLTTSSFAYAGPCVKNGFYVGAGLGLQTTKSKITAETTVAKPNAIAAILLDPRLLTSTGGAVKSLKGTLYSSGTGFAGDLRVGYAFPMGRMYLGAEALIGFGTGKAKSSVQTINSIGGTPGQNKEVTLGEVKPGMYYGARVHGGFTSGSAALYGIAGVEMQRFKYTAINLDGLKDENTPTAKKTGFAPVLGLGAKVNLTHNIGLGLEWTYAFYGNKDVEYGYKSTAEATTDNVGIEADASALKVGTAGDQKHKLSHKNTVQRVMAKLTYTF